MEYQLRIAPPAQRDFKKLAASVQHRVATAMRRLASDPMPPGARQLKGQSGIVRIRVGDYRILYVVHRDRLVILVIRIGHRREVYNAAALKRARRG